MTRKDYERIAKAMSQARSDNWGDGPAEQGIEWACRVLADTLAEDNPRFNREKFLQVCDDIKNPHEYE